ncbi:HIT domain-containing protein [Wenzhouxiangella marina]|uniref:Histidine triad (HIT) protein n=1 Tax=Wenzhouxiangella marina TaxID=1579979 RepID=A0A0K0XUV0_9GAMM|nr:HIT family protein [Wenzhouxiangella marina]AKS41396.1 histidine triad (HIT) protein [Wenzhouxiangella marina]
MNSFQLDPRLAADSLPIDSLELCQLRLMNDQRFPWLLLVPARPGTVEVLDLDAADQMRLWDEIRVVAGAVRSVFAPDKLNIAALGNVVPQLHVHVIGRFRNDAAWPAPVWGVGTPEPWPDGAKDEIERLRRALQQTPDHA